MILLFICSSLNSEKDEKEEKGMAEQHWTHTQCVLSHFSRVRVFLAHGLYAIRLLCPWILQPRVLEWVAISSSINPSLLISKPKVNGIDKMCVYQKVK